MARGRLQRARGVRGSVSDTEPSLGQPLSLLLLLPPPLLLLLLLLPPLPWGSGSD